jgi:hypothetical protein
LSTSGYPSLSIFTRKIVVPIGVLPPHAEDISLPGETIGIEHEFNVIDWLNKHPPKSVLYIALGSEAAVSAEQLHEMAFGLEKSAPSNSTQEGNRHE